MAERLRRVLLAALLVLPTPLPAASALTPLERFYTDTRTLAGQFTQTVTDASGVVTEESRGEFAIERPGRFRWDYRTPFEQIIVADGHELWVYEPDLDQATVRPVDEQTADAPGLLLAGARFPAELFDAVAEADGWLRLIPTRADSGLGSVRLQLTGGTVQALELHDGLGQTTRIELHHLRRNEPVPASRFSFTPPAGVDVIRALPAPGGG